MKAIGFTGCNATYAENQSEYLNLPVHKAEDGLITTCWELSFTERIKVVLTGRIFLQVLTFNKPLQPLKMLSREPKL